MKQVVTMLDEEEHSQLAARAKRDRRTIGQQLLFESINGIEALAAASSEPPTKAKNGRPAK